jgi:DNA-binding response OmpR family regulator
MPREREHVTVVSSNPETLRDLERYLVAAGFAFDGADGAKAARAPAVRQGTVAAVVFPDDFPAARGATLVRGLRRARPRMLVIVVTSDPQRLGTALDAGGRSLPPIVLARPPFGWEIVEAIRSRGARA